MRRMGEFNGRRVTWKGGGEGEGREKNKEE